MGGWVYEAIRWFLNAVDVSVIFPRICEMESDGPVWSYLILWDAVVIDIYIYL